MEVQYIARRDGSKYKKANSLRTVQKNRAIMSGAPMAVPSILLPAEIRRVATDPRLAWVISWEATLPIALNLQKPDPAPTPDVPVSLFLPKAPPSPTTARGAHLSSRTTIPPRRVRPPGVPSTGLPTTRPGPFWRGARKTAGGTMWKILSSWTSTTRRPPAPSRGSGPTATWSCATSARARWRNGATITRTRTRPRGRSGSPSW
mmetsp:Transcript_10910/g.23998  ORF Transcript_10910/g.23998 Transcript_10910/m.23998 type:complete len:204 (+) Transcript_10910:895-1506(+)